MYDRGLRYRKSDSLDPLTPGAFTPGTSLRPDSKNVLFQVERLRTGNIFFFILGPLTRGPQCRMSILRNGNVVYPVAYLWPCRMSNLRNRPVACQYIFESPVACR